MNKLDKQFEEMMKGIKIDSPSSDFALKVMSRVQAEAAVKRHSLIENYQPVISKRTWIILIAIFVFFFIYVLTFNGNASVDQNRGILSDVLGSVSKLNATAPVSILKTGVGIFRSVPPVAYLIVFSSMLLWTIDSFLSRMRQRSNELHIK